MEINYLAVLLSALSGFFLGFIWYTFIFSKPWQRLIGMSHGSPKEIGPSMGKLLVTSFILQFLMALNLSIFIGSEASASFGLLTGLMIGLGFVSLSFGISYLFEGRPLKLWLINAGYYTLLFSVSGLIIGAF